MRLKVRILVRVLTLSAMLLFFFGIGLSRGGHNQVARAKARHFFLKAAVKEAEGKMDEAHEYYKLAYQSDTSYHEAAYNYGLGRLARVIGALQQDSVELEENISFLRKMSDLFPRDVDFSETYAFYLVNSDSLPKALDVYRRLIGHRPGLSRLYITQAYLYAMHEEIDSAVNAMREYERLEGVSSESTLRKASYHLVKGDTVGALEEFRAFAETNPRDIETIMSVSMAYNLLGRQDSAYSIIKDASVKYPDNMALQFELALIAKEAGDVEEFFRSGSKALKSQDIEDIQRLGMLEDFIGALPQDSVSYRRGEELMKELASMMGDDPQFLNIYTSFAMLIRDFDLAFDLAKKSYLLNPEDAAQLGRMMSFSVLSNKPEEGMKAYDEFQGEDKKNLNLVLTYITAAEATKQYEPAVALADTVIQSVIPEISLKNDSIPAETLEKYGKEDRSVASAIFEVGAELYSKMGLPDEVIRCYENALALDEDNVSVKNNYAYYAVETKKAAPGSPEFERAKQMSYETLLGQNVPYYYYDTYAWILFKEREFKEALKYQELAIENAGDEIGTELLDHYGDILFMNGEPEEALKQWEKALEADPENAQIKKKVDNKTFFYE